MCVHSHHWKTQACKDTHLTHTDTHVHISVLLIVHSEYGALRHNSVFFSPLWIYKVAAIREYSDCGILLMTAEGNVDVPVLAETYTTELHLKRGWQWGDVQICCHCFSVSVITKWM